MTLERLRGIFAAVVTPFSENESIDEAALARHVDFLARAGIRGVVPIGGSGEYVNLSADERRLVVSITVDAVAGRVPVIVGALGPSTREAIATGKMAREAGAAALLVLPPYYIAPSDDGVVCHFREVAREVGLPVIVYNNPPRTGRAIGAGMLDLLASIDGVVAVKDCDRDLNSIAAKIESTADRISYLCGDDDLVLPSLMAGAHGAIMALPNLAPRLAIDLFEACTKGELGRARELQAIVRHLVDVRKIPNHPGPLKEMMAMAGRSVGPARRPLLPMTDAERTRVARAVEEYQELLG